jgi:hypothetical protein
MKGDAETTTEPLELTYTLHLLPRGRINFRRWRWELWDEPHLLAAGWRLNPLHAQRALRAHAFGHVHRLHGVHPLPSQAAHPAERPWGGGPTAFHWGDVRVVLRPRALLDGS